MSIFVCVLGSAGGSRCAVCLFAFAFLCSIISEGPDPTKFHNYEEIKNSFQLTRTRHKRSLHAVEYLRVGKKNGIVSFNTRAGRSTRMITRNEIYRFYTEFEIINYLIVSNVRKLFINFYLCAQTIIYEAQI